MLRNIYFFAVSRGICYKFFKTYSLAAVWYRSVKPGGFSQSASLFAHNQITDPQIRLDLYLSCKDYVSFNIPSHVHRVHLYITDAPESYSAHYFFLTTTLSRCQISSTYSSIVLSEVNLPLHAVLRSAFLAHPFSSL